MGYREATATIMGPNNASHVVWTTSESFFKIRIYIYILNDNYRYYLSFGGTEGLNGGGDDDNEPKRRVLRRLSPR